MGVRLGIYRAKALHYGGTAHGMIGYGAIGRSGNLCQSIDKPGMDGGQFGDTGR